MENKFFYKKYFIILSVITVMLATNYYLAGDYLQNVFYRAIIGPSVFLNDRLSFVHRLSGGFLKVDQITNESAQLKEENNILRGELAQLENLKRENQFLRDQLGVARRIDSELLIVRIFNIYRGATSSTAILNKGAQDGVRKSMPVIAAGNILVGLVDEVFDNTARVLLLDDPRIKISGRIQNSRVLVDVVGRLQNELVLNLVAVGDEVKEGDTVITSGLDGLPEALLIAKITKVETPSGVPFKTVMAQPLFDPSLGSSLFVIIK